MFFARADRFDEVEAQLSATRLELDAARTLSKSQAEALVDVAASEKAAARDSQVGRVVVVVLCVGGVWWR